MAYAVMIDVMEFFLSDPGDRSRGSGRPIGPERAVPYKKATVMLNNVIRLLITDDHAVVRDSLRVVMSTYDDIEVIGEAANGQEAVELCEQIHPDLVLMDLVMPIMDGVTATKLIRQCCPETRVLVLTSGTDPDLITDALSAGAKGYLQKYVSSEAITNAMWSAMAL
jgi:two-component system, NarL family, response regulator LiaR